MKQPVVWVAFLLPLLIGMSVVGAPPAAVWRSDLSKAKVPGEPAAGKIHGERFVVEKAELQGTILTLRQGQEFFADREFKIFLFSAGQKPEGKTWNVRTDTGFDSPHVHMSYRVEKEGVPKSEVFSRGFAMRLSFGKAQNGRLPGSIYLCLPDARKSFVAGRFNAVLKK
jgi:hypothetical protein